MSDNDIFKRSSIYKVGQFYQDLGEAMVNPETTIDELSTIGWTYGFDIKFFLQPVREVEALKDREE